MDEVSEVKSRLNVEDVVAQYIELKRSGRNFKGLSPFTNEKTPSFMVSPEKQIWHDFSSGKGGDIFSFVMEMEGLDFRGALELLARQAGVDPDQFKSGDKGAGKLKKRAFEAMELATHFYQKQLINNRSALAYLLKRRQFTKKTIIDWRLGYSPKLSKALADFLTKKGFTVDEMKRAGLITERRQGIGDMFRDRIMIPLSDSRGLIVGFTARQLQDDPGSPKYINTPQTVIYDKGRQVFGLHLAKDQIRKSGFVVVVEGNLDVISSHQAGITNVVASAGTAMTSSHLKELRRFTTDVRLSFDADQAGLAATERMIPLAQKEGIQLSIIKFADAKDPDELIHKDARLWRQAVESAQYAPDWLIERYASDLDLNTAQGKRIFTDALVTVVHNLADHVEQEHYLKQIAKLTDTSLEAVMAKFNAKLAAQPTIRRRVPKLDPSPVDRDAIEYQKLQDHFLGMLLMRPDLRDLAEGGQPAVFDDGPPRAMFEFLKDNRDLKFKGDPYKIPQLREIADYVKIIALQFEELYQDLEPESLSAQAINLKKRLLASYVKIQKHRLAIEMQRTTDEDRLSKLIMKADKLNQLIK